MRQPRWPAILAAVCFVCSSPVLAQGPKTVRTPAGDMEALMRIMPEETVGFVFTSKLDQCNERIDAVLKKLGAPVPASPLELAKATTGVTGGLDVKGGAAVALIAPKKDAPPVPVYMIPVSDYQEFLGAFKVKAEGVSEITLKMGMKMVVANKGQFALLAEADQADALKFVLNSTSNLAKWSVPLRAWILNRDLAMVATPYGIKTQLATARDGLAKAKAAIANAPNSNFGRYLDWMDELFKSMETDVTYAGLASKVDKAGNLIVDARLQFVPGSGLANAAGGKSPTGPALGGMPSVPFAIAAAGTVSESMMKDLLSFDVEILKGMAQAAGNELPKEKLEKLDRVFADSARGLRGMGVVLTPGKPGDTLFAGAIGLIRVDNAPAYLERYQKMLPEMNAIMKDLKLPGYSQATVATRHKVGRFDVLEVTTTIDIAVAKDPMQMKIMEAMYGKDSKLVMTMAPVNNDTIIYIFKPVAAAKDFLEAYSKRPGGLQFEKNVFPTLNMLPGGAQWVVLVDPKGTTELIGQWMKAIGIDKAVIPAFPQTPPVGVAVSWSSNGWTMQAAIPVQVLEGIGKIIPKGDN